MFREDFIMMKKRLTPMVISALTIAVAVLGISGCTSTAIKSTIQPKSAAKILVGYYASDSIPSNGYTPDKIDPNLLTHINFAFANIGEDLKISVGYPDDPTYYEELNALKQENSNLKTLISIGGMIWSDKFSAAAYTEESRTAFAESCVDFIVQYGFDGVDIDWEAPSNSTDKHNFTLLLQKLREKLDSQGLTDNKHYLLTIAGSCNSSFVSNTELSVIEQYLDYANLMTYDIHGPWDSYTDFNSPLYNDSVSTSQYAWSADSCINAWLEAGFPASKIVLGIPFFCYKYNNVNNENNGLYQRFSGYDDTSYDQVVENYLNTEGYIRYWNNTTMMPWLFDGSSFISYEDPQSVAVKAAYVKSNGLGGAMIWELSQDQNNVLLKALYTGLQ